MSETAIPKTVLRGPTHEAETLVHFERSPGSAKVELHDLGSRFDQDVTRDYPHSGPMVNPSVAKSLDG